MMTETILKELGEIERQNEVKILFACESGSRAWGFASPDSDYDVRFIYARPKESYLSIRERRDVIELPINDLLDINGWDIRKALQLFVKSNAPLYEWLQSPLVYMKQQSFISEMQASMPDYFSFRAGCHHYLSMTRNVLENELGGAEVKLKKYFYALRPALAAAWIIEKRSVPPMEFGLLRSIVEDEKWQAAVDGLLERKKDLDERALVSPVPVLHAWLQNALIRYHEPANAFPAVTQEVAALDQIFRRYIL